MKNCCSYFLFAGILTFFGFFSTIASNIIESSFDVKTKEEPSKGTKGNNKSKEKNKNKIGEGKYAINYRER